MNIARFHYFIKLILQSEIKFKIFNFKSVCECSSCYKEREREREKENLHWTIKWESKFSWIVSYGERNGIYLPLVEICWFYKCKCSTNPILVFYSKYIIAPHDTGFEKWGFTVMVATVVLKPSLFE